MSTPAVLCDPFAALLLHRKQRSAAAQASPEETMGPNQTTTDNLPLYSPSRAQGPTSLPSPLKSANELTHIPGLTHPGREPQPLLASSCSPGPNICNFYDQETNMSDQGVQTGMVPVGSQHAIEALHKFIQEERIRNFSFLGMSSHRYMKQDELLVVVPATRENIQELRNRCPGLTAYGDHEWYTFHQLAAYGTSSPTVVVTVPAGSAISVDEMTIMEPNRRAGFTSTSAVAWLHSKYEGEDAGAMKFSEEQYEEQFMWWNSTGKAFPLLNLPAELRDAIYLQVLGPVLVPDIHASQTVFGRGLSYNRAKGGQKTRDPNIDAPNMAMMCINRQVKMEILQVATRDCQKRLRMVGLHGRDTAQRSPIYSGTHIARRWLSSAPYTGFFRKLQLEMSAAAAFELIGIKPTLLDPWAGATGEFSLSDLGHFTALKQLDFSFLGPKHEDAVCPWAVICARDQFGEHSCQKLWIDWFFTLGWEVLNDLRHHNKIRFTLSGCVKISSRQYWERVLNAEDDRYAQTIKAAEARIRQQKTDNSPIPCRCSTPCSKAGTEAMGKQYTWTERELEKIVGLQEHVDDIYWKFKD